MAKQPKKPVTLRDVAKEADVSYQTVSRAVNGLPGINPATRDRILELARKLGYRRNSAAGMLRTNRSRTIGVVISDIENTFFGQIVQAIETEAYELGYSVLLANSNEDLAREQVAIGKLLERRIDGIILAPAGGSHAYLAEDVPSELPIVTINRAVTERETGSVLVNNRECAKEATEHLLRKGHRSVAAMVVDQALMTSRERLSGFQDAMREAGLDVRPEWIREGGLRRDTARMAALGILSGQSRPTAFFTSSAMLTEGALLAMRDLGLRHGTDVDLVGFDLGCCDLLSPPVPIIRQPTYEIGRRAIRMVLDMIEGRSVGGKEIRLKGRLEVEPDLAALRRIVEATPRANGDPNTVIIKKPTGGNHEKTLFNQPCHGRTPARHCLSRPRVRRCVGAGNPNRRGAR